MDPLPPVVYHGLDETDFQTAPCSNLALALFMNKSIEMVVDGIQSCCSPQSIFSRALSTCFGSTPSFSESCPELNQTFTEHQITPLHLAAMSQNLDAISLLASRGVDLDAADVHGLTPYHHMAVQGNLAGLRLLSSLGANTELRTHDGGTAEDFLRYTAPFRDPAEWKLREETIRAHHEIDPTCLEQAVAVVDSPVAPPQVLADFVWNYREHIAIDELSPLMHRHLIESHNAYVQAPPRLKIEPSGSLSSCGLFAQDPIPKGGIVGYYGGEVFLIGNGKNMYGETPESDEYAMNGAMPIYAHEYRSPGSMANDGFPNVCFMPLSFDHQGVGGLPYQIALVATEEIQPGEEIVVDYGIHHDIKKEGHIEPRQEAMARYFSKSTLNTLLKTVRSAAPLDTSDKAFTAMDFFGKMNYAFQTPGALELLQKEAGLKSRDLERLQEAYAYIVPRIVNQ